MGAYTAEQRRELKRTLDTPGEPSCPACGETVRVETVERPTAVSYVRQRVLIFCPGCRRTAAVDRNGS